MNKKLINEIELTAEHLRCMTSISNIKSKEDAEFLFGIASGLDTRFITVELKVGLLKEIIKYL